MKEYEIKIDIGDLVKYSEVLKPQIDNETMLALIAGFSRYIRALYMQSIEDEIYSRRYKGNWEPVEDPEYLKYIDTIPSAHIIDLMYEAIEIREIKDNIIIRFDPHYIYPGSKIPLVKVLKSIDSGTSKFNARPILKKIVRQLRFHLHSLWRGYLKKKGVA